MEPLSGSFHPADPCEVKVERCRTRCLFFFSSIPLFGLAARTLRPDALELLRTAQCAFPLYTLLLLLASRKLLHPYPAII